MTQLSAGDVHTCGNTAAAHCWGWNLYGQVGDGTCGHLAELPAQQFLYGRGGVRGGILRVRKLRLELVKAR